MTSDLPIVKLDKLTYGGDALGRLPNGRAVFIPYASPGETVRLRTLEEKNGRIQAELAEVLEPSAERIAPRCRHFGVCGGCHYQHITYQAQLNAKTEILRDQLTRIGKIEDPPVEPIVPAPQEWNYRNHVQFHVNGDGKLGYIDTHRRGVIPVSECHLPELALNDLWPRLELEADLGLKRVSLRVGVGDEMMLVLESNTPEMPELELDSALSVVHLVDGDAFVMAGDDHLVMKVDERLFRVSAGSFFQVNTAMAEKMVAYMLANLPVSSADTLLDVYCGVGLFGAFFAPRVGRLIGIELSSPACEDFTANLDEFDNVELYEAAAEKVLPALDVKADTIIVDPPRAGLDKRLLEALIALNPSRVAYVSCDPATLGRDAARLIAGGYRLMRVTPFDLFPQTYHIESISLFEKS
jgi:23S rRNA (uracil1939-C5)-methyltransferase